MTILNYYVNYIDIMLVAIFILFTVIGYAKGILLTIINFIRWSVGMFLCFYFSTNLAQPVYENSIKPKMLAEINSKVATTTNIDEVITNLQAYAKDLPPVLTKGVDFSTLTITNDDIANSILTTFFEGALLVFAKVLIFAIVFVVFFGATGLIIAIIKRMNKRKNGGEKSPLRKADKFFGGIFGMLKATVIVLAVSSILICFVNLDGASSYPFIKTAESSQILQFIDEINPFNAITEGLL